MNIEESIQQINELIEAWELNEACLNQTDIDAIKCLLKQNKELKQKYLNAVADYETTMSELQELKKQLEVGEQQYNDLVEEKEGLQEQLSIKTLQLEECKKQVDKGLYSACLPYKTGYNKAVEEKENQQKEFIKFLEDNYKETQDIWYIKILQKYKEIIGVSHEQRKNIRFI